MGTFYCFECVLDCQTEKCPSCGGECKKIYQCRDCDWQLENERARCNHCGGFLNDEMESAYFSEGREYTKEELILNEAFGY